MTYWFITFNLFYNNKKLVYMKNVPKLSDTRHHEPTKHAYRKDFSYYMHCFNSSSKHMKCKGGVKEM